MAMRVVNERLGIVVMESRFAAPAFGRPSSLPIATSEAMLRTRVVRGAIVTSARTRYAAFRESSTTGRRPTGAGRSAHQISPWKITIQLAPVLSQKPK